MNSNIIETHHGENFDVYKVPAPEGLSGNGSTATPVRIGEVGYTYQANPGTHDTILGDNFIGFQVQGYNGTIGAFDTEIQMLNISWVKSGDATQNLLVSKLTRIDMTNIRVYNVCFD
jgi:hypothetical protein